MLAWVRAGLAVMALGYSLDRLGLLEAERRASNPYHGAGIVLVCLGTVAVALALLSYLGQRTAIETAPIRTHLPARLVHCLANTGDSELRLLAVFRPAGSPAEAYYPDGTPAVMANKES